MISATYQVTEMTCEHCVHAVTEELTNVGGVTGVIVGLVPGGKSAVTMNSARHRCLSTPSQPPWMRPAITSSLGADHDGCGGC